MSIWSCLKTCKKLTQFCAAQFVEIILKVAFVSTLIPHIKVVSTITRFPPTKVRCYGHINTAPFMWILFNGIFSRGQSGYDAGLGIHCLVYNVSLESRRNRDTFSFSFFFLSRDTDVIRSEFKFPAKIKMAFSQILAIRSWSNELW